MSKPVAIVFFVVLYVLAVYLVCVLNAEQIMRDAVLGVALVAGVYMMFLLPAAAAGAAAVSLEGIHRKARGGIALLFAALLALLLELLFAASASERYDAFLAEAGMLLFVAMNVILILSYFGVGALFAKRGTSSNAVT